MSWARLDDQVAFHAKTIAAGNEAFGAWARMLAWSCAHMTDGKVPRAVARSITTPKVLGKLVDVRLLDIDGDGYAIHDFLEWNPSQEQERAKRAARAEAGRIGGRRSGEARSKVEANASSVASALLPSCFDTDEAKPNPVPVPVPVHTHTARAREGERAYAGEAQPVPEREPMSSEAGELLAALRRHEALRSVADVRFAETLEGRRAGRPVAWVAQAIADAAADTPTGETAQAVQRRVRAYCDRARAPDGPRAPPARSGQAVQPITPEGVGWKRDEARLRAEQEAWLREAGKDAPL